MFPFFAGSVFGVTNPPQPKMRCNRNEKEEGMKAYPVDLHVGVEAARPRGRVGRAVGPTVSAIASTEIEDQVEGMSWPTCVGYEATWQEEMRMRIKMRNAEERPPAHRGTKQQSSASRAYRRHGRLGLDRPCWASRSGLYGCLRPTSARSRDQLQVPNRS